LRLLAPGYLLIFALLALSVFGFFYGISHGKVEQAIIILATLTVGVVLTIVIIKYQAKRVQRLLQSPSADALITCYEKTIRPGIFMPNADVLLAHSCAMAYILYGEFGEARMELNSVSWEGRPPVYAAIRRSAEALLCYLDTHEYERGLALARSAVDLADMPTVFPGAKTGLAAFATLVYIGEVLTGRFDSSTVEELETNFETLPLTAQLLIAWALVRAYRKAGDDDKVEEMCTFLREVGPHCKPLHHVENGTERNTTI
jgi:hypothetical protein